MKKVFVIALLYTLMYNHAVPEQPTALSRGMIYVDPKIPRSIRGYINCAIVWGETLLPPPQYPRYLINLKEALHTWTDLNVILDRHCRLDSPRLLEMPFVYITTSDIFELTYREKENVKKYFENGGFMVLDNARPTTSESPQEASFKKLLFDALGDKGRLKPVPLNHPVFNVYFDLPDGAPDGVYSGPFSEAYYLPGIWIGDKLVGILSNRGYTVAWDSDVNNEPQLRFGINLVIYALFQAGGSNKDN